jgi:hypothetical protein
MYNIPSGISSFIANLSTGSDIKRSKFPISRFHVSLFVKIGVDRAARVHPWMGEIDYVGR